MGKSFSGHGVYTAIVTPFRENGAIDWTSLEKLVAFGINGGIDGIVVCGTTGEAPTLTDEEQQQVLESVVRWAAGQVSVIAGTGTYCTKHTIERSKRAADAGADALLIVTPYYNKPTQIGLQLHYEAIDKSLSLPIIIYNIKGRTGVNLETATLLRILDTCENVCGVKDSSGDLKQIEAVISSTPADFAVLSGDDPVTFDLMRLGGDGVVSVASNIIPKVVVELVAAARHGNIAQAAAIHERYQTFFKGIFLETNPLPIKTALAARGYCQEVFRLPLCEMQEKFRDELLKLVGEFC
jgi:4-hydroxy-tetrahydrodipicolinate synthase